MCQILVHTWKHHYTQYRVFWSHIMFGLMWERVNEYFRVNYETIPGTELYLTCQIHLEPWLWHRERPPSTGRHSYIQFLGPPQEVVLLQLYLCRDKAAHWVCWPSLRSVLMLYRLRYWPDDILTLLQELACACHFLFVQQGQSADGQVQLGWVLENTLIHPCVLHTTR